MILLSILLSRIQKVNKLKFAREKRSTLWPENEFFKSKMDVLTVLSNWDTEFQDFLPDVIVSILKIEAYKCNLVMIAVDFGTKPMLEFFSIDKWPMAILLTGCHRGTKP